MQGSNRKKPLRETGQPRALLLERHCQELRTHVGRNSFILQSLVDRRLSITDQIKAKLAATKRFLEGHPVPEHTWFARAVSIVAQAYASAYGMYLDRAPQEPQRVLEYVPGLDVVFAREPLVQSGDPAQLAVALIGVATQAVWIRSQAERLHLASGQDSISFHEEMHHLMHCTPFAAAMRLSIEGASSWNMLAWRNAHDVWVGQRRPYVSGVLRGDRLTCADWIERLATARPLSAFPACSMPLEVPPRYYRGVDIGVLIPYAQLAPGPILGALRAYPLVAEAIREHSH